MNPSHETGVRIAGRVWQDVVQKLPVNLGKIGRPMWHCIAKVSRTSAGIGCQTGRPRICSM